MSKCHSSELNYNALIEPSSNFFENTGLLVAHSVSPIRCAKTTVLILNPSLSPITVSKNENLGMAQPIDVKGVHVLEQSPHSNLKQNSQHIIQKMISKLPDIPSAQKESLRELLTEFQDDIDDGNNMAERRSPSIKLIQEMQSLFGNQPVGYLTTIERMSKQ